MAKNTESKPKTPSRGRGRQKNAAVELPQPAAKRTRRASVPTASAPPLDPLAEQIIARLDKISADARGRAVQQVLSALDGVLGSASGRTNVHNHPAKAVAA